MLHTFLKKSLNPIKLNPHCKHKHSIHFHYFAQNLARSTHAYSLVESIISVVVLGILISVAIPNFTISLEKTRASEGVKILSTLLSAQRAFFAENQAYATDIDDLDITLSAPDNFNVIDDSSVDNDPTALAEAVRTSGAYTLTIDENGDITCNDGAGTICGNLGY